MIIEITGVNTWNKGAELMLLAILEHFRFNYPDVKLAVNRHFGSYEERAQYGLLQKVEVPNIGRSKLALSLMPASFRAQYGLIKNQDIDAVIDASGFAFGDQHPAKRTLNFAQKVREWDEKGKPVLLLPQALGPFENPTTLSAFGEIIEHAKLVFARDPVSLGHALKAAGSNGFKVKMAPDFTNLVSPEKKACQIDKKTVVMVPNQRMIEKAKNKEEADAYLPLLSDIARQLIEKRLKLCILIHGEHDIPLAKSLQERFKQPIQLIYENDPSKIKGILGQAYLVVASRFHALVSALSQGVPSIATSWSHKYEMLFKDYHCEKNILPVPSTLAQIQAVIESTLGDTRKELLLVLQERAVAIKSEAKEMWKLIDKELGLA